MARNMAMLTSRRVLTNLVKNPAPLSYLCRYYSGGGKGEWGSGAGKGGGAGGAVREAGGAFGKKEVAQEDAYFRRLQAEQLARLKEDLKDEIEHHEEQIKRHQELVNRHKKRLTEIAKSKEDD